MEKEKPSWYKIKGYPHFSSTSPAAMSAQRKLIRQIENPNFVSKYSFYPLLHVAIRERKYKKHPLKSKIRVHSYLKDGSYIKTVKSRPIHYANHKDALIFGYYAEILNRAYEEVLTKDPVLSDCVTAYRKIPTNIKGKNKGTVHFAYEAFCEISNRTKKDEVSAVLAFDIKNFFPTLDHGFLKNKWKEIMNCEVLDKDHENVFKAATSYSFIYKTDLHKFNKSDAKSKGFDEQHLARIRNSFGINSFFETPKAFREAVKSGRIRIYPNSKKNSNGDVIGIPQGLPISAVLANMYLLDFDRNIIRDLVNGKGCYYRRYSDDIVIICSVENVHFVNEYVVQEMKKSRVEISKDKTEQFQFKNECDSIQVYKLNGENLEKNKPFIYLGFEFYGYKTLVKSANLSRFYRRMIYNVKKKCQRAKTIADQLGNEKPIIYKRQLYKLYRNVDLEKEYRLKKYKRFEQQETGQYLVKIKSKKESFKSNYFSYVKRAAEIMNEPKILNQTKSELRVFNQTIQKHLK